MNEFEWLRQTRSLNQPQPPDRDLWPAIERQLKKLNRRSSPLVPWAMAASIGLLTVLAAGIGYRSSQSVLYPDPSTVATHMNWQPSDPRLTGAAVELQAARAELAGAIQQAPKAAFLRRLMARTNAQEARLRRFGEGAG